MNPASPTRFTRDAAGLVTAAPVKAPHCAYCGERKPVQSVKVRGGRGGRSLGYVRLDVCGDCRVSKLGFQPERT